MARFFQILILTLFGALLSVTVSAEEKNEGSFIKEAFEGAMDWVVENELEAPAASRIYVLTSITLHDAWSLSHGQNGYIVKLTDIEGLGGLNSVENSVSALFNCLDTGTDDFSCKTTGATNLPSERIVSLILERLPYPSRIPSEQAMPEKHSVHPEWRRAEPLELPSANAFRPSGPPPEDSAEFQKALLEVKRLGEDVSEIRLADQSLSAAFWGNPAGTITPPGHWNDIALSMFRENKIDTQLDVLLALNIALYDAGIAAWDSKYHFLYPRPDETIRRLDRESPTWTAMGDVPLHPEYVSGHSAFSGAAAAILTAFFAERPFCNTSKAMWGLERCFTSFTEAAEDAGQSRIYGGLHYQFSNQDGLELGRKVAQHALNDLARNNTASVNP
jgi:hypothetical protein